MIDSGRVSHAQMVLGDMPTAMPLAWAYLQYLCCQNRRHYDGEALRADSCGECPSCKKVASLMHPDVHMVFPNPPNGSPSVSAADYQGEFRSFMLEHGGRGSLEEWHASLGSDIKSSMIRERDAAHIVEVLTMKPYEGGWRMLLIWKPTRMNSAASNELLKTLEEPLPQTLILLVDDTDEGLLPTIKSRVQTLALRNIVPSAKSAAAGQGELLVGWLRLLFKLKMKDLAAQVDRMAALNREQQKQFLQYAASVMRECFLNTAAGLPCDLGSGDAKFDAQFPQMITNNNIEAIESAFDEALMATDRNAYAKITLMELSFRLSKALKKR
ncbi:MAG: hypothetical protein J6I49_05755 [Bacteroidales bacterium]|nr:hypothetical protein [Bacteroidales bacterium]